MILNHGKWWQTLKQLTDHHNISVTRTAEIGVYYGSGSIGLREVYPESVLYLIDPWSRCYGEKGGNVWSDDCDKAYSHVCNTFKNDKKVNIMKMLSSEASSKILEIDLVFIDGDHSYEHVLEDIKLWYPKIKRGLIAGHDYARHGDVLGIRRAVVEFFGTNHTYTSLDHDDVWYHVVGGA